MKQFKVPRGKTLIGIYDNFDKSPLSYFLNKCKFVDKIVTEEKFVLKKNIFTDTLYAFNKSQYENTNLKLNSLNVNLYLVDNLRLQYLISYYSLNIGSYQDGITDLFNIESKYGNVIIFTYIKNFINNEFLKDYDN